MAFYQTFTRIGKKLIPPHRLFKVGFNLAPMYRRSTARVTDVSEDLLSIKIKLPISYRNRNYVGSTFGGSMFSAVDPIPMVQLINLLGEDYVVWDKSAQIAFRAPAREDLYAEFCYSPEELAQIIAVVETDRETEIVKTTALTNRDRSKTFCEVSKTIFVSSKAHYKQKLAKRRLKQAA